jgi:flagellar hook-associated protein 1 FlgK
MSLFTAVNIANSGLSAISSSMQLISGNISNAQNTNYSRKSITFSPDATTGGVNISGYTRVTNKSLDKLLQVSLGNSGLRSTQQDYLQRIQDLLGSSQGTPTLTNLMSDFAAAWRQLSVSPDNVTQQQNVIFTAQSLAREVNRLGTGLTQLTNNLQDDMDSEVDHINTLLGQIEALNDQISASQSSSEQRSKTDMLDERDAKVRELSTLVGIQVFERSRDTIAIYTPAGLPLLDNAASQFSWDGTSITLDSSGADVTPLISGGRIEALVGLLDQGTPTALNDPGKASVYKVQQQLEEFVDLFTEVGSTFVTAYDSATTGAGELASGFFTGTSVATFAVNINLLNGTSSLKEAAAVPVSDDMDVNTRTVAAGGLTITNTDYAGYTNAIITAQNQNTQFITNQAKIYETQSQDYTQRLQSELGVNLDEEVAALSLLQNNYAAAARVLSVIQEMFRAMEQIA